MNRKTVSYLLLCVIALSCLPCLSNAAMKQENGIQEASLTFTNGKRLVNPLYQHNQVRHGISVKKSAAMPSQALLLMKQDALISDNLEQRSWFTMQLSIYQACRELLQC